MEAWKKVWREGLAPLLTTTSLRVLQTALQNDDQRLIQGVTVTPPTMNCFADWPVEAACLVGYCGWQGEGLLTVAEVEEFFARMCHEIDVRIGESAGCRHLLNWFDETTREEMRRLLSNEIALTLEQRE